MILVIVMSFVAVQSVCADTLTGKIDSISYKPNIVEVAVIEVYGVRFKYLDNRYNIDLDFGDEVTVDYYEFVCSDGTSKYMACKITVDDVTIVLRECK